MEKEILINGKIYEYEKGYPSFALYHMKGLLNIRSCILWTDLYKNYDDYGKYEGGKKSYGCW